MSFEMSLQQAQALDAADPLAATRASFVLPAGRDGQSLTYLCGHSLGLAPREARARVAEELDDWERLGVLGHESARRPWIHYAEALQSDLALLCGALPAEVAAMNSLTVNLHLLLASFYRPSGPAGARRKILIEAGAFPSDRHVVTSQLAWHGGDAGRDLLEAAPRAREELLRIEDIETLIDAHRDELALVLWPGVQYRTGQAFDLARLAAAAQRAGAIFCVDLAHSIGNLPLSLHDWNIDCAAWCGYKYLNGGPGALGGIFVHQRHGEDGSRPRLSGWWGHEVATRFRMEPQFNAATGAAGWQLSNPPILSTAPLLASLAQFNRHGMATLRAKSLLLTGFLRQALERRCSSELQLITPPGAAEHGCQLSLRISGGTERARQVYRRLATRGLIADWREPDIVRIAPVPLYNGFVDVWQAADVLTDVLHITA